MKTAEFEDPQLKKAMGPGSFEGFHLNVDTEKTRYGAHEKRNARS